MFDVEEESNGDVSTHEEGGNKNANANNSYDGVNKNANNSNDGVNNNANNSMDGANNNAHDKNISSQDKGGNDAHDEDYGPLNLTEGLEDIAEVNEKVMSRCSTHIANKDTTSPSTTKGGNWVHYICNILCIYYVHIP